MNADDGSDSWYETSCDDHDYAVCDGDYNLNWKDKGYVTVFDLLQVHKFDQHLTKIKCRLVSKFLVSSSRTSCRVVRSQ